MISKPVLRKLINQRLLDAKALFAMRRYHAAIYLGGYAIELALKYKICKLYDFSKGFPENKNEFQTYYSRKEIDKPHRQIIKTVQEIRNHDLEKLLMYSGSVINVKIKHTDEWTLISKWNPEMRYKISKVKKSEAKKNLAAIEAILDELF